MKWQVKLQCTLCKGSIFVYQSPPVGTLSKVRANGDTVFYNQALNAFAIKNAKGVPRTMYKSNPSIHQYPTNLEYFYVQ